MYILIVFIPVLRVQIATANEKPTMDETISYLETKVPELTGNKTYFSARILGEQVEGTKEENYRLKIFNGEIIIIEKSNTKFAKTIKGEHPLSSPQTRITEVIRLENLDPKITLIYKTSPTESDDIMKAVYPPHIKIIIRAKPENKWKVYKDHIEQVTSMLKQTGENSQVSHYESESCMLITSDEASAENIARAFSHLILLSGRKEQKNE